MTFVSADKTVKVDVIYVLDSQRCIMTSHWKKPTTVTEENLQDMADTMGTWWAANVLPFQSNVPVLQRVEVFDLSYYGAPMRSSADILTAGGVSSASVPNGSAVCITKRTDLRGRSYRGRMYLPGWPTTKVDSPTTINGAWLAELVGNFADWLVPSLFEGFTAGVLSYFFNGAQRSTPEFTPISAISADTSIDSQRRRLLGRGD